MLKGLTPREQFEQLIGSFAPLIGKAFEDAVADICCLKCDNAGAKQLDLLGGFSGLGGGSFYGTGYYGGGALGAVLIVLIILVLLGRL